MKAKGVFVSLLISLTCVFLLISGCHSSSDPIQEPASAQKAIMAFSLNSIAGTIDENAKKISVIMPSGTNVTALVATFTTTGKSVAVNSIVQVSGTTANDFSSSVTYTVTAADDSTVTYTVTVAVNRTWHHPAGLSDNISSDGQDAWNPQVAMDKNGNAIIVWSQGDYPLMKIFKSEYRSGSWTHPASLSDNISPDGQDAGNLVVAMGDNGNAIIVWQQSDGVNSQIFKSEYRNGVWHHPANLSENISPDGQNALAAQVAMDNNGNAIIVWSQGEFPSMKLFKSEYRSGSWTHPANISDYISPGGPNATSPAVAMDDNGNAIIVWNQGKGLYEKIFKSEYRNGVWHHPASLSEYISPDEHDAGFPAVAMDENGNIIITWDQYDGSNYQIFKSEYR